ncbi:DeoR/GlpR family DNA-binding transcription regulator [Belliella sp. DSM 111904]|uniref:DeoR/GlpR family DNA-binding transcription regulator n=1 Tax=Belliella filtrata TaxID=2923435 RepID=A0ABS9UX06_9BACT|nr:transcriptional repressor AgaR [Belliella filtrata]MCH7408480.1 DeoR/GlpR family DNA-binding transcription regulator [Belliella filtrata]
MKKTALRRSKILEELESNGQVNVTELSREFDVSEVTIRNDLANLERNKLLVRAHGGAFKTNTIAIHVAERKKTNLDAKRLIGKTAAQLIQEGDSIILDSGTTTFEIAKNLVAFERLSVISNALDIINHLANSENIEVIVPGGYLRKFSMSLVGPLAEKNFKQLHCNKLFLGVDGFKADFGVYTYNMEEAYLNQFMIEVAEEVIVVADSSKFKKIGFAFIAGFNKIHKVITDNGIDEESLKMLQRNNVEVIVAK